MSEGNYMLEPETCRWCNGEVDTDGSCKCKDKVKWYADEEGDDD